MRIWLQAAAVILAVTAAVAPIGRASVERWFSTTTYPAIQHVVTPFSNLFPFALFDVLTVGAALALLVTLGRGVRQLRRERRIRPVAIAGARVLTAAAVAYLAFLSLWGFNYRRIPMTQRIVMEATAPPPDALVSLGLDVAGHLNALYEDAHRIGWREEPRQQGQMLDAYAAVQRLLSDAPAAVPGRLKRSIYGPYFRWITVDGMVNPFALEVIANPDLLPFERPFVAAHEWAHLAGYADESEANFVGWLTCIRADVPSQYSGWQSLYWQVAGDLRGEERRMVADALQEGPRRDLDAIAERVRRGQLPFLRNASWRVYD